MNRRRLIPAALLLCISAKLFAQHPDALNTVQRVADKVIADTRFAFKLVPQKDELGMQIIDFRQMKPKAGQQLFARTEITATADTTVSFGISFSGKLQVWVDGSPVSAQVNNTDHLPKEVSYNRFAMSKRFRYKFEKGKHQLLVRLVPTTAMPVIFLLPSLANGDLNASVSFGTGIGGDQGNTAWSLLGPFDSGIDMDTQHLDDPHFNIDGKPRHWVNREQRYLSELVTDSSAAYQRDPYADWHYAHGSMVWAIMGLDSDGKYSQFAKQYVDFTLHNAPYFQYQYDSLFALRGSYHRIFRRTMLDDTGAPVLPFAELYLRKRDSTNEQFFRPIADYVINQQHRLPDGTFCRPEPVEYTVWADDLFMSVPFLLRMAKINNNPALYDDAVKQVLNFRKYLYDPAKGLYKHAWFDNHKKQSSSYWGRANGWTVWAAAELLSALPTTHPKYKQVLANFQDQMKVLATYQDTSGMWHQVLNRPDSYGETSCTALFTLAFAKGVRMGWLNKKYKANALKGWSAVARQIDANGVVHGICRGTDIGENDQFYMDRKTIDNDPRGMGAVITAGLEVSKLK